MSNKRIKILILGQSDVSLSGHVFSVWKKLPEDLYESKLIVLSNTGPLGDSFFSFYDLSTFFGRVFYKFHNFFQKIKICCYIRSCVKIDKSEYSKRYFSFRSFNSISGKDVIKKCLGFNPDVIFLGWASTFVSAETIRELYELTSAFIVFNFVDEQYLTGGCHYPIECNGYLNDCSNCPVLLRGKEIASCQLSHAKKYLSSIPKIVCGVPYDCRKAKESPIFNNAKFIPVISTPQVSVFSRNVARNTFLISEDDFVILIGAQSLDSERKGFKYAVEAVNVLSETVNNVCLLAIGGATGSDSSFKNLSSRVRLLTKPFLPIEDLFKAYCAADCYLSSTIADSGPMMVNYAVSLGCPVVSFDIGVAQDLVLHKKTGYIAKYKDSASLAEGLTYIYNLDEKGKEDLKNNSIEYMQSLSRKRHWSYDLYDYLTKTKE